MSEFDYPINPEEREKFRQEILQKALRRARQTAFAMVRSIKCEEMNCHAGDPYGCKNDGHSCICECHDLVQHVGRGVEVQLEQS